MIFGCHSLNYYLFYVINKTKQCIKSIFLQLEKKHGFQLYYKTFSGYVQIQLTHITMYTEHSEQNASNIYIYSNNCFCFCSIQYIISSLIENALYLNETLQKLNRFQKIILEQRLYAEQKLQQVHSTTSFKYCI